MTPNPSSFRLCTSLAAISIPREDWSVQVLGPEEYRKEFRESLPLSSVNDIMGTYFPTEEDGWVCIMSREGHHRVREVSNLISEHVRRLVIMGWTAYLVHLDR
ncbi:hypothetical protein [Deinococcus altitudinis]|uniref:hypothetical protein n=1 Tax=Deinococcus altitudinis TaxID=468914 RepID=UPI003891B6CB